MQEEKYNSRERSYSAWHRRQSTRRFVGIERAQTLAMIDLDASLYVEYDDKTKDPLALIETARDVGQNHKTATVTKNLARLTHPLIPAYVLLYTLSDHANPADPQWFDITAFRVKRIHPTPSKIGWTEYTPQEWCNNLVKLREWAAKRIDIGWRGK